MSLVEPLAVREPLGGKGESLRSLSQAGFPVPEFAVAPDEDGDLELLAGRLGYPLVVRSSASVEDSPLQSFAGMFESFLGLWSFDQLRSAVHECRASVRSDRVRTYCEQHGVAFESLRMHVIVQRMVQAELSGVAFTINPTTGSDDIVIEAVGGLADQLMAGRTSPMASDHSLLLRYRPQIEDLARRVQLHFGRPQDIEFAVADGVVYIVQARPITRIQFSSQVGEWTNADFRDGGVSSSVCSPLMWSLYEFIWDRALKGCLRELHLFDKDFVAAQMFFGRPYWNLGAVKKAVSRLPGFVEREFDQDLSVEPTYTGSGVCTPLTIGTIVAALPCLVSLPLFFRRQLRQAREVLANSREIVQGNENPCPDGSALHNLIEGAFAQVETAYFRTVYAVSLAKLDFKQSFPSCDYVSLMGGLPEIRHLAPVRRIRELIQRGETNVEPLIQEFRHHCRFGIDVIHPRWDEDYDFVQSLMQQLDEPSPASARSDNERLRGETIARVPWWKRRSFQRKLDRLRQFVWLREELRDLSSQMYYLIRKNALTLARQRQLDHLIFFQTFREICQDDRSQIDRRRETYYRFRNFPAPNEIGSRFQFQHNAEDGRTSASELKGISASSGVAVGTAFVAMNVEAAMQAPRGTILICPFTEPGWTPALSRVSAVVTEVGGLLSHAAVLCREFGIPAVLGVPRATQLIPNGATIEVNAECGTLKITPAENR